MKVMVLKDLFNPRQAIPRHQYIGLGILFFVCAIVVWIVITAGELVTPLILPAPLDVADSARRLLLEEGFLGDIRVSLVRIAVGFVAAAILAVPLGKIGRAHV